MADVPQLPLKEFFKLFAPTYVLGTTYTISLAFFEGLVFPEIKRANLERCLILCDKIGFRRATVEASALKSAGREYMAVCAPSRHSFHPKVWLMIGDGRAAVLVGSGNLTQSGFMDNAELFDVVEFEVGGRCRTVAEDVVRFLAGLRALWNGVDSRRLLAIEAIEEMQRELQAIISQMPNEADPDLRFLSNFDAPLVKQFGDYFAGGTLQVAAPYFGGVTGGLQSMLDMLAPLKTKVFPAIHGGKELDVSLSDLNNMNGVSVHALKMSKKNAFSHLKVYGFDSDGGQWLFTTSANCTVAALGGDNVEAGLLRRVNRALLDEYFAEEPKGELPSVLRHSDFEDGSSWLVFWAVDRGNRIELFVSQLARLPLSDVTITVKSGGVSESHVIRKLFGESTFTQIGWDLFKNVIERAKHTTLISLQGVDADGRNVQGEAMLDNPLLLTSDPTHRSAWRAALSLLESEGLPESSDLASIFHLIQEVFEAEDDHSHSKADQTAHGATSKKRQPIADKTPIWPPIADQELYGMAARGGQLHDLQWFQKILAEFLNPRREGNDAAAATTADAMDDEVVTEVKQVRISTRVVNSIWKQAASSFHSLQSRLMQLVINSTTARKIWPVSTAVLLATLLTRLKLVPHAETRLDVPSAETLIGDFLKTLFVDRIQTRSFVPLADSRHQYSTYPSIAEDLYKAFGSVPSNDIAGIIFLMFAYWHRTETRAGRQIPANTWLLFRDIAPSVANRMDLDLTAVHISFHKFIFHESDGVSWSDIEESLTKLSETGWQQHEGYQDLCTMMSHLKTGSSKCELPEHLNEWWPQTQQRIQRGQEWYFPVDILTDTCVAKNCSGQNVTDPKKRKDLRRLAPTICSSCGAVLIPDRLWAAYEANHE